VSTYEFILGCLAALIAAFGAWVAYRQYRNDQLKIRHDLYDRRLAVFNGFAEFLAHISQHADASEEAMRAYLQRVRESYFLFGKDISEYLDDLYRKAVDLRCNNVQLHGETNLPVGEKRTVLAHENAELCKSLTKQWGVGKDKFARYLALYEK
jgi:hypothetical protein